MNRPSWFIKSWGVLAKAVIEEALEDLNPTFDASHVKLGKLRADAVDFFESGRFKKWAKAAGFSVSDIEQAYLDQSGDGLDK